MSHRNPYSYRQNPETYKRFRRMMREFQYGRDETRQAWYFYIRGVRSTYPLSKLIESTIEARLPKIIKNITQGNALYGVLIKSRK